VGDSGLRDGTDLHVYSRLLSDLDLEEDDVESIAEGREEGEGVSPEAKMGWWEVDGYVEQVERGRRRDVGKGRGWGKGRGDAERVRERDEEDAEETGKRCLRNKRVECWMSDRREARLTISKRQ
jgi:hypothetical protein